MGAHAHQAAKVEPTQVPQGAQGLAGTDKQLHVPKLFTEQGPPPRPNMEVGASGSRAGSSVKLCPTPRM